MTTKVFSVKRETPLTEVAELMARENISGLPVVDEDGKPAGIISGKDFLAHMGSGDKTHFMSVVAECLTGKSCVATPIRSQKAEDIMTSPAVTVKEDIPAIEIATIFTKKNINRVLLSPETAD
jgi:CBS domain-containing protein